MSKYYRSVLNVLTPAFSSTKSMAFDGVDDYVKDGSSIPNLQTGDISFSAWIYPTSFSSYNYFLDSGAITTKKGIFAGLEITTGFVAVIRKTGVTNTRCTTGFVDCGLTINNWYNIVGVFDEDGGTAGVGQLKLYVNGVLKATVDGSGQDTGTGYDLHIGKSENDFSHFVGNIDEVSLYDYPLTSGNVTTIYNSGVPNNLDDLTTPPTSWYRMGENGVYKSPQWLLPENSNKDKASNYSFAFDGVGDNIDLGTSILDGLGTLSISFWFNTSYNSWQYFLGDNSFRLNMNQAGDDVRMQFNGSVDYRADPLPVTLNTWNNIVVVFDGSLTQANRLKLYLNGSLATNILSGTADTTFVASNNFRLGRVGSFSGSQFVGMMDEVAFFNTALTSGNVTSIYNSGTPTTLPDGAVAHYKMGEEATFSTNWTIPDGVGSADGTSANMTIEDRVGEAPNSTSNSLSYNMDEADRETDVPS